MVQTSLPSTARHGAPGLRPPAVPMKRMDRTEFMAKLAPFDEERMRKALWNLYWRGPARTWAAIVACRVRNDHAGGLHFSAWSPMPRRPS